ncbi:hypothetical protein [Amycolatopsis sp. lyj-112]|uniref:hypothetical protein n=1 Tax=Amycolatopsis sp. lyj-112 TaxID=2789288 RepID=UPI00397B03CF
MKIKMVKNYGYDFDKRGAWLESDSEVEVEDSLAARLLSEGRAVPVVEEQASEKRARRVKKEGA